LATHNPSDPGSSPGRPIGNACKRAYVCITTYRLTPSFCPSASGDIDVVTPEEVYALARAADSEQDAAVFVVAAFTGLRMGELRALRWRDVDFAAHVARVRASYADGLTTTPKSGKVRSVPLVDAAAE
jgi:integrase